MTSNVHKFNQRSSIGLGGGGGKKIVIYTYMYVMMNTVLTTNIQFYFEKISISFSKNSYTIIILHIQITKKLNYIIFEKKKMEF